MLTEEAVRLLQTSAGINQASAAMETAAAPEGMVALPQNFQLHDLEKGMQQRRRARGVMKAGGLLSLMEYVERYDAGNACCFVDGDKMTAAVVLNLGTIEHPGQADDIATHTLDATAEFNALNAIANGQPQTQRAVAEFMEDWGHLITCSIEDGGIDAPASVANKHAIAAIRKLTIEEQRKVEASDQSLSASRTAFEQVKASGALHQLPTHLEFTCEPYPNFEKRAFVLRLGVLTGGKDPMLTLRIAKMQEHRDAMADELVELTKDAAPEGLPVYLGTYTKA